MLFYLRKHTSQTSLYKPFFVKIMLALGKLTKLFIHTISYGDWKLYVNKDCMSWAGFVVLPNAKDMHLTLLIGDIKSSRWLFFDFSLIHCTKSFFLRLWIPLKHIYIVVLYVILKIFILNKNNFLIFL